MIWLGLIVFVSLSLALTPPLTLSVCSLINGSQESPQDSAITRDINRTFPAHDYFKDTGGDGQDSLYKICKVRRGGSSRRRRKMNYPRGGNGLASESYKLHYNTLLGGGRSHNCSKIGWNMKRRKAKTGSQKKL